MSTNCKDWTIDEVTEIKQICGDLKYMDNKQLKIFATERIDYLASKILEHLEYMEVKEVEED